MLTRVIVLIDTRSLNPVSRLVSASLRVMFVDGLSAGQLHHVVVYPPRAHAILGRAFGGTAGITYSSWTAAGRVLEGPGR